MQKAHAARWGATYYPVCTICNRTSHTSCHILPSLPSVELHNVPRSALSRVIKEFITRDKVPRNTSWEIHSSMQNKRKRSFVLHAPLLFVPLTTSKVLPLEHAKQKKALFCFAFSSLIRTSDYVESTSTRACKTKESALLFCILLAYSYLCRRLGVFAPYNQLH